MATYHLDDSVIQPYWDNSEEPRLAIKPGDTVVFECLEAAGQLRSDSTVDDYLTTDRCHVHALVDNKDLTREQVYVLCSATTHLHISEIVDVPNWIVSAQLPLGIFKS